MSREPSHEHKDDCCRFTKLVLRVSRRTMPGYSDDDLRVFREEYQQLEKDINTYIGLYLSGLLIVTGYVLGKDAKSLHDMIGGNAGYNIYAFLVLGWGNLVFGAALAYKSLDIQEITQFITANSAQGGIYPVWESWRRSDADSLTKKSRPINFGLQLSIPICTQLLLLFGVFRSYHLRPFPAPFCLGPSGWFWILSVATLVTILMVSVLACH